MKDERAFEDKLRKEDGDEGNEDEVADEEILAEFPDDADELELTHSRIRSLRGLDFTRFAPTLKRIFLRQNFIPALRTIPPTSELPSSSSSKAEGNVTAESKTEDQEADYAPFEKLPNLEELDLYDNRISKIEGLEGLSKLESLDLSFNNIRTIPPTALSSLTSLKTIYLIQNKISKIQGLEGLAEKLTSLELGGNRLRKIENLSTLVNLTELWLGKNKISKLEGLGTLKKLKILSIQSNRIVKMEGFEDLTELEELYISHNGIIELGGLERNDKVRVIDIAGNRIEEVKGISHLKDLEEFWANDNKIPDLKSVETSLSHLENLSTVYLEGNPLQKSLGTAYRRKVKLALPQIGQIDAVLVSQAEADKLK